MQTMEHKLFIAGEWVESAGGITFQDLNPATGELCVAAFAYADSASSPLAITP
jgi:acyl-CoA reductase-like NAD-dependent aldehyde dehydrogenase